VDLLPNVKDGDTVEFNEVLLTSDESGNVQLGEPALAGASVSAQVVGAVVKGQKIDVVHFRRRKDSHTKVGHRQKTTQVKIQKIQAG
jgi:large subunit ribosomal protein L21